MSDLPPRGSSNHEGVTYPTWADIQTFPLPNYTDPPSRKAAIIGVETTITILAVFVVALRFYARTVIKNVLGWDDWLMFFAMICSIVITILHCLATQYASGLHLWDVRYVWIKPTGILTYASLIFFGPAVSFSKISLSMTHLRILPGRADRIFARCAIAFSIGYCVSITFVNIFQCSPISAYWDLSTLHYKCVNERRFNYAAQALNSSSDFLIFLWPVRSLWSIRVPVRQRLILIFVFSIGSIVCIAGIFRLYFLSRYFRTFDYFWTGSLINILHSIELNFAIICGCLPGIKPILSRLFPRLFTSTTRTNGGNTTTKSSAPPRRFASLRSIVRKPTDAARGNGNNHHDDDAAASSSRRPSDQSMIEVPVKLDPTEFAPTSPALPSEKAHWSPIIAPPPPFQYPKSPIVPVERVYESNEEYRPPIIERPSPVRLYHAQTHDPETALFSSHHHGHGHHHSHSAGAGNFGGRSGSASAASTGAGAGGIGGVGFGYGIGGGVGGSGNSSAAGLNTTSSTTPPPLYGEERERVRRSRHHSDPHPGRRISGI